MKKVFVIKVFVIFFIIFLAIYLSLFERYDTKGNVRKAFPNLIVDIKKINKISIQDFDNKILISRENNKWYLDNYNGYPVDIKKINAFFLNLYNGTLLDKKKVKDEGLKKIGLNNLFDSENYSKKITLYNDKNVYYDFIIGNKSNETFSENVNYFKELDTGLVWLFKNSLKLPKEELSWINSDIFKVERWRIKEVKVLDKITKESFTIYRSNFSDESFKFLELPKGYDFKKNFSKNTLVASFENIKVKNILPYSIKDNYKATRELQLATFDGLVLNFQIINIDKSEEYIRMFAKSDRSERKELDSQEQNVVGLPKMKTFNEVEKEANTLEFLVNWMYQFDDSTMSEFKKKKSNIIKKK